MKYIGGQGWQLGGIYGIIHSGAFLGYGLVFQAPNIIPLL